ncbi:MAG TPA: type II toxin-antitoxin system VapC family toxin [Candidatus Saccharimonadales bacterium]|nr:type II toxin-antitoxin system VapC family toxin [Candidatus Saccharimonadales bacterium]
MILLDTNVFIYLANGKINIDTIKQDILGFASITKIEALGYTQITAAEQQYLEALFFECEQLNLAESVIQSAIKLRQRTNMTLGDAIIAATALEYDCELYTANEKDFSHIDDLRIHNPLTKS